MPKKFDELIAKMIPRNISCDHDHDHATLTQFPQFPWNFALRRFFIGMKNIYSVLAKTRVYILWKLLRNIWKDYAYHSSRPLFFFCLRLTCIKKTSNFLFDNNELVRVTKQQKKDTDFFLDFWRILKAREILLLVFL